MLVATACRPPEGGSAWPAPIDPQRVQDQDLMTWDDYHPIPGRNRAGPSLKPARGFRLAVVAIGFPGLPFLEPPRDRQASRRRKAERER